VPSVAQAPPPANAVAAVYAGGGACATRQLGVLAMLELPEVTSLAAQVNEELAGVGISFCERGNSPHKWVWYSGSQEEYQQILVGGTIGTATAEGSLVIIPIPPDHDLAIGDGGCRLLLHEDESTLPARRHFLLGFEDGRCLTVNVAGWGGIWLKPNGGRPTHRPPMRRVSPISDEFTYDCFKELLVEDAARRKCSVKAFMAGDPMVTGIGNGYVQDICFRARLHPRRDITSLTGRERLRWYHAIRKTLREAIKRGGRDTEFGLHGQPGGYVAILDKRAKGQPCPECGDIIEKVSYLGGSCYFCPTCQPLEGGNSS